MPKEFSAFAIFSILYRAQKRNAHLPTVEVDKTILMVMKVAQILR